MVLCVAIMGVMVLSCHAHSTISATQVNLIVNNSNSSSTDRPSFLSEALSAALSAAAAHPECQVIQRPTPDLMVAYFKKHLQQHMTAMGLAGTEDLSLSAGCRALRSSCCHWRYN